MSQRVMSVIESLVPAVEVYSIDKNKLHTVDTQT
jgi:DNA polymerase V